MNREVFVNIKVKLPKECDVGFSDNDLEEIRNYYEKEFSNFDYLVGEINVSFVDEKTKQIDQLKQQNEELMLKLSKYEIEKHKPAYCTLAGTECEYLGNVDELKQQLAEKDTRIAELEDKDWYEACIKQLEEQNNRLIDTLKEKDKEIERLNTIKNNAIECADLFKVALSVRQKDLAIQELEKAKDWLNEPFDEDGCFKNGGDLIDYIDQQIKELKGNNDEPRQSN